MSHPLKTTVEDFVQGLKTFEREYITQERIREFMDAHHLSADTLKPYTYFRSDYYTRNLVYRDDLFEMMVICWQPNQKTAVHTHNGQLGWMQMAQGEVAVHNYKYQTCDCPERQNVVGLDCLGGAKHIELERLHTNVCNDGTGIYEVDKIQSIHQIENTDKSDKGVVSLHVYSLPFDSCIAFNMDAGTCCRKQLSYYSRFGKVEGEVEHRKDDELRVIG
jgi:cysteine dioxygenase